MDVGGELKCANLFCYYLSISIPAFAEAQATDAKAKAKEILKHSRAAIGDEKKMKNCRPLLPGSPRYSRESQNESELQIDVLMPDKIKQTTNGQGATITNAHNGEQVWTEFIPSMEWRPWRLWHSGPIGSRTGTILEAREDRRALGL